MIAILGIIIAVIIVGGLLLFRYMGRIQPPSAEERLRHNETEHPKHPRASGLD